MYADQHLPVLLESNHEMKIEECSDTYNYGTLTHVRKMVFAGEGSRGGAVEASNRLVIQPHFEQI